MAKESCCKRQEWASSCLHKAPHDLVRWVYLSNAKAYKHEWGIAGKLSPWPFDSCKPQCDTEHAIVAALRKVRKGHVNGDPGVNQTSAWPIYMYTGQDRGGLVEEPFCWVECAQDLQIIVETIKTEERRRRKKLFLLLVWTTIQTSGGALSAFPDQMRLALGH